MAISASHDLLIGRGKTSLCGISLTLMTMQVQFNWVLDVKGTLFLTFHFSNAIRHAIPGSRWPGLVVLKNQSCPKRDQYSNMSIRTRTPRFLSICVHQMLKTQLEISKAQSNEMSGQLGCYSHRIPIQVDYFRSDSTLTNQFFC